MKLKDNFFGLIISKNGKTLDQWNFNGEFILTPKPITATIGNDSLRVVYFFLFKDNKIYLNCLNPFENKFITKNKFVVNFIPVKKI